MSDFSFLEQYILPSTSEEERDKNKDYKHFLFMSTSQVINSVNSTLPIPIELKQFFENVGYGFFFQQDKISFDSLLNPNSFKIINLREEYYEFDPDLELYEEEEYQDKLIFFEVNEGVYLLISKEAVNGKNAIYYFDEKIADSLEEFLIKFDKDSSYFED